MTMGKLELLFSLPVWPCWSLRLARQPGFSGPIWAVNSKHCQLQGQGQLAWPHVAALLGVPDLARI